MGHAVHAEEEVYPFLLQPAHNLFIHQDAVRGDGESKPFARFLGLPLCIVYDLLYQVELQPYKPPNWFGQGSLRELE